MTDIHWYSGTAYDFFISLVVLHHAADFGLRPYWSAGVRQRLSDPHREFLERVASFTSVPLDWISSLPEPKDALPVLNIAAGLDPTERFRALTLPMETPAEVHAVLQRVSQQKAISSLEKELVGRVLGRRNIYIKSSGLDQLILAWREVERSSDQLLAALQEYYSVYFSEEEARIRPGLKSGLEHARRLARNRSVVTLVEELSRGVHFEEIESAQELTLVPSFWSTPFVFHTQPAEGKTQVVFGCRAAAESVAPGAELPDTLINALKALADPTRLRVLRHLSSQPLSPTELSRLLRLRPPTVLHHLQTLRLAGLVTIHVSETGEKRYTSRAETLDGIFSAVKDFIGNQD